MRRTAWLLAVILGPLAQPGSAAEAPRKPRPGRFKLGPLFLTPRLQLKNAGVDTNVFNSSVATVGDTVVVLSPTLDAALPVGKRLRLSGRGFLDLNYFERQRTQRSTDGYAEGRAELDVGRVMFFGGGGGGHFRQRFSLELDERLLREEKRGFAGATLHATARLSLTGQAAGEIYKYEGGVSVLGDSVKAALDRNTRTATLQLQYGLTRLTSLVASADVVEDRFLAGSPGPRQASSRRYLAGLEFSQGALVNGRILAGLRDFPGSNASSAPAYRGPAFSVDASVPLARVGRLALLCERDVTYSVVRSVLANERLRNSFVTTRAQAELAIELPFDLVGKTTAGFQEARYLLPYPRTLGAPARRVDHLWSAGGSLLRRFGDSTRIGGTVAWLRRVSRFPGASFQGFRYGIQAELVP